MRATLLVLLVAGVVTPAAAHHPDRECDPVTPRIDVIGPLGNCLPEEHRRKYNRPTYWGGKIAYKIAPSSQEAMAWHRAEHRGDYDCDRGRVVSHYFYLKPYEAMRIGSRRSVKPEFQPKPARNTDYLPSRNTDEEAAPTDSDDELDLDVDTDDALELEPVQIELPSLRR